MVCSNEKFVFYLRISHDGNGMVHEHVLVRVFAIRIQYGVMIIIIIDILFSFYYC